MTDANEIIAPVHPYPPQSDGVTADVADRTAVADEPAASSADDLPPAVEPPDIDRLSDDPKPTPSENLSKPMM